MNQRLPAARQGSDNFPLSAFIIITNHIFPRKSASTSLSPFRVWAKDQSLSPFRVGAKDKSQSSVSVRLRLQPQSFYSFRLLPEPVESLKSDESAPACRQAGFSQFPSLCVHHNNKSYFSA